MADIQKTYRKVDILKGRHTERQTYRIWHADDIQRYIHTERQTYKKTDTQKDRYTEDDMQMTDRKTNRLAGMYTERQNEGLANSRQLYRHTDEKKD
jgi:hypothetical protein